MDGTQKTSTINVMVDLLQYHSSKSKEALVWEALPMCSGIHRLYSLTKGKLTLRLWYSIWQTKETFQFRIKQMLSIEKRHLDLASALLNLRLKILHSTVSITADRTQIEHTILLLMTARVGTGLLTRKVSILHVKNLKSGSYNTDEVSPYY